MPNLAEYESSVPNAWCPGCGNFGILQALKQALVALELAPHVNVNLQNLASRRTARYAYEYNDETYSLYTVS